MGKWKRGALIARCDCVLLHSKHSLYPFVKSSGASLLSKEGRVGSVLLMCVAAEQSEAHTKCYDSNLVDPASSHTLVSKIKPCMCKYKRFCTVKLRTAHYISNNLFDGSLLHG